MTEQEILYVINHSEFDAANISYHELVQRYVRHLASISDLIHYEDLVGLMAIAALLHKKSQESEGQISDPSQQLDGVNVLLNGRKGRRT